MCRSGSTAYICNSPLDTNSVERMPFRFEAARLRINPWLWQPIRREHAHLNFVSRQSSSGAEDAARQDRTKERHMITKQLVLAGCTAVLLSVATAHAGPCNTDGKSAQDAGAGPTPGHTGQTIGSTGSTTAEHPPTNTMNRATGDVASSSQDAQKQMQGQPTAAQQGQGAQPSAKIKDQDC